MTPTGHYLVALSLVALAILALAVLAPPAPGSRSPPGATTPRPPSASECRSHGPARGLRRLRGDRRPGGSPRGRARPGRRSVLVRAGRSRSSSSSPSSSAARALRSARSSGSLVISGFKHAGGGDRGPARTAAGTARGDAHGLRHAARPRPREAPACCRRRASGGAAGSRRGTRRDPPSQVKPLAPVEQPSSRCTARGLSKRFESLVALDDLDLDLQPGCRPRPDRPERVSGKTTALRALAGELGPDSGSICLGDDPLEARAAPRARAPCRGVVGTQQTTAIFPDLTVLEHTLVGAGPAQRHCAGAVPDAVPDAEGEARGGDRRDEGGRSAEPRGPDRRPTGRPPS